MNHAPRRDANALEPRISEHSARSRRHFDGPLREPTGAAEANTARRFLAGIPRAAGILALTLGASSAALAQGEDEEVYVIQEQGGTYVLNFAQSEEDESMTLYQFVQACEQVTKLNFTWGAETEALLKNQQVNLLGAKTIKKERFYSFFQVMMIISDFVCTEIGEDDISVIKIDSLATAARNNLRAGAIYVEPERLAEYEDQPATLITTVVSLPNTDVRQVSNSMRSMITDPNTQQMLPAGNSQSMVLVGFGSNVVALANMLKIIDTASKTEPTPAEFDVIKLEYASAEDIALTCHAHPTYSEAVREAALAREVTKLYETIRRLPLSALAQFVREDNNQQKGEIVLLVTGASARESELDADVASLLIRLAQELPAKRAAAVVAVPDD